MRGDGELLQATISIDDFYADAATIRVIGGLNGAIWLLKREQSRVDALDVKGLHWLEKPKCHSRESERTAYDERKFTHHSFLSPMVGLTGSATGAPGMTK